MVISGALKNAAFKVYLSHKMCDVSAMQGFYLDIVEFVPFLGSLSRNELSKPWRSTLSAVEHLTKCIENALWELETFGVSYRVSYVLAVLDRSENCLHWAMSAATSEARPIHRNKFHMFISLRKSAAFLINEMMARLGGDHQLGELWGLARKICDAAVEANTCKNLFYMKDENLTPYKLPTATYKLVRPCSVSTNALKCFERFARRAWACSVLENLVETPHTCYGTREAYERKKIVANNMAALYRLGAECTDRAAVAVGGWAEVWNTLAASLLAQTDSGLVAFEASGDWRGNAVIATEYCKRFQLLQEQYEGTVAKLEAHKRRCIASHSVFVESAERRLAAYLPTVLTSSVCLSPNKLEGNDIFALKQALEDIQRDVNRLAASANMHLSRSAYFLQQAQRIDRSISPAHEQIAECWLAAAVQARIAEDLEKLGGSPSDDEERTIRTALLRASKYAHLALSTCADAASYFQKAQARSISAEASQAWQQAAVFTLQAAQAHRVNIDSGDVYINIVSGELRKEEAMALKFIDVATLLMRPAQDPKVTNCVHIFKRLTEVEARLGEHCERLPAFGGERNKVRFVCKSLDECAHRFLPIREQHEQAVARMSTPWKAAAAEAAKLLLQLADYLLQFCAAQCPAYAQVRDAVVDGVLSVNVYWSNCSIGDAPMNYVAEAGLQSASTYCRLASAHLNQDRWCLPALSVVRDCICSIMDGTYNEQGRALCRAVARALRTLIDAGRKEAFTSPMPEVDVMKPSSSDALVTRKIAIAYLQSSCCNALAEENAQHREVAAWCTHAAAQWNSAGRLFYDVAHLVRKSSKRKSTLADRAFIHNTAIDQRRAAELYMAAFEAWRAGQPAPAALWAKAARCNERNCETVERIEEEVSREDNFARSLALKASDCYSRAARTQTLGQEAISAAWEKAGDAAAHLVQHLPLDAKGVFIVQREHCNAQSVQAADQLASAAQDLEASSNETKASWRGIAAKRHRSGQGAGIGSGGDDTDGAAGAKRTK